MKKAVQFGAFVSAVLLGVLWVTAETANAFPQFKKEFDNLYMTEGSELFKAYEGKSNCNVCHEGKDKKKRNAYGMALDELLTKDDKGDADKIKAALEKVESMHSVKDDKDSPTFGELIKTGKLPITK